MKQLLKNISPFNNRTEMPAALFILKKFLAFWVCYIAGLFIAEGMIILIHFACGKNMLVGDVFDAQTIALIMYYGYIVMAAVAILYWKLIEKKPLKEMGLTKHFGNYLIGAVVGVILLSLSVVMIVLTGNIEYHGFFEHVDVLMMILFRGVLLRHFIELFGNSHRRIICAVFVSSLLFGILHLINFRTGAGAAAVLTQVGYAFIIGVFFSALLLRTNWNLLWCGIVHSLYDIAAGFGDFAVQKTSSEVIGNHSTPDGHTL